MWRATLSVIVPCNLIGKNSISAGEGMRKGLLAVGTLALALGSLPAWAAQHSHSMSHHGGGNAKTCEDMNVNFDDRETYMAKEEFTLPAGQLDVTAAKNGGVSLQRADGNQYEVQVCKFVAAENKSEGDQLLSQIQADKG